MRNRHDGPAHGSAALKPVAGLPCAMTSLSSVPFTKAADSSVPKRYYASITPGADTSRVPVQHFTARRPFTGLGTVTVRR